METHTKPSTRTPLEPRLDYGHVAPGATRAMMALENYVHQSGLERSLLELVKIRSSQLNGCAYCLDMHTKDARANGETEQRIYTISAWRETPFFSERERAALLWAETLTKLSQHEVSDEVFDAVHAHFSDEEMVNLSMAIIAINGWNRLSVGFAAVAGTYEPKAH